MLANEDNRPVRVMVFGVGAFTQSVMRILKERGAEVSAYLTRDYGHYSPALEGPVFSARTHPDPCPLLREHGVDLVIPMSIDWSTASWAEALLALEVPIFSPVRQALRLERDRDFAARLCRRYGIPCPQSYVARNRLEAENVLRRHPAPYVIKNPLCSPTSPVHTIVCESEAETRSWLKRVNYEEGVFLQEYMGDNEAGHIALVSGGELYPLITNQEYKRAFDGNMGIVAGAPLGGLVERDPEDRYGLAEQLLEPLLPWFREVNFHGPVQVTAAKREDVWHVLEYNVRIGVTSGPILLEMLDDPVSVLLNTARDQKLDLRFRPDARYGCSLTLAGYGYPYSQVEGPSFPIRVTGETACRLWWNEVDATPAGELYSTGQRLVDVVAVEPTLPAALQKAYADIRKIRCLGSYYRTDIGQSLWPPGSGTDAA